MLRIRITLEKIKLHLTKHEIEVLLAFAERVIVGDNQSKFDLEYIHAAWLASLKELCVFLMDRNLDRTDKTYKLSLSESQYMTLMELFKREYPEQSFVITGNSIYGKLHLIGINKNLIKAVDTFESAPLLKPSTQLLIGNHE